MGISDFAIVGETMEEDRFIVMHQGETKADLPLSRLSSSAPEYDPSVGRDAPRPPPLSERTPKSTRSRGLKALVGSPKLRAQALGLGTVRQPGHGQHRAHPWSRPGTSSRDHETGKMLAFTSDVTPRYVKASPVRGRKAGGGGGLSET